MPVFEKKQSKLEFCCRRRRNKLGIERREFSQSCDLAQKKLGKEGKNPCQAFRVIYT